MMASDDMLDHERLALYVERYFRRRSATQWPTVREAAKALRWSVERVESAVEGDPDGLLALTYYNVAWSVPLGDKFVEST